MPAADVVDPLVVALGDDRQRDVVADADLRMVRDQPRDDAVVGAADVQRIGQHDRHLEEPRLVDPVRAAHLAVAVERPLRGGDAVVPDVGVGDDRGRAGAHVGSLDLRQLTDAHAGDVGDPVDRSGRQHADVHRAARLRDGRADDDQDQGDRQTQAAVHPATLDQGRMRTWSLSIAARTRVRCSRASRVSEVALLTVNR
jgi:hypothetical protein